MKNIALLFTLLTVQLTLTAQVNLDSIQQVFHERVLKTMKKQKIVGASIAVVSSDSILWIDNFGHSDLESQIKVTENTLFGLGSVTKVFTSTAVLQLADKHLIDIDQPFSSYLTSFHLKDGSSKVTPRNIITHHSGLPSDIFKGMFSSQPENYKVVADYMSREYLAGIPNQIRSYSNPGYTLLGHMIAEVSGQEYDQYIKQTILQPLRMTNSAFNATSKASLTYNSKGEYAADVLLRDLPAGGLFSSTSDMSKFLVSYLKQSPDLLKETTFSEVLAPQHIDAKLNFASRYALGWSMTKRPHAGDIFNHSGTTLYFNSAVAFSPKADVGVIILTNSDKGGYLFRRVNEIIETIAIAKGLEKEEDKDLSDLGNKKRLAIDPAELKKYEGTYVTPGSSISVYKTKKKLYMKLQGLRAELIPVGENTFVPKIILLKVIPIRINNNRMYFENVDGYDLLTNTEEGSEKEMMAVKLAEQSITPQWQSRFGSYKLVELLPGEIEFFQDYNLENKDGLVVFSFKQVSNGQKIEMALELMGENRAKIAGLGRYAGQSITYENGVLKAFGIELKKD